MKYERIPMTAIHPIIKGWIAAYMGTYEYFIIDAAFDHNKEVFEYLILKVDAFFPFKLTLKVNEDGQRSFKTAPRPFNKFSLTLD